MVRRISLLFLLIVSIVAAAPTVSISQTELNWTGWYSRVAPTMPTISKSVLITNSGDGSLTWSATFAVGPNAMGRFMRLVESIGTGTVSCTGGDGHLSLALSCTGTGDLRLVFNITNWWGSYNTPGTYSTTLTVAGTGASTGSSTIPVTLAVVPSASFPLFTYRAPGCTNSNAVFSPDLDKCSTSEERPPVTTFVPPSLGGTYTDPDMGGKVRVLSNTHQSHNYASVSPVNRTGTYLVTTGGGGTFDIRNATTGNIVVSNAPGSGWFYWSNFSDNQYYYFSGQKLYRYTVGTGATELRDFTSQNFGGNPTSGGQGDLTRDEWIPFHISATKKICTYNIPGDKLYCGSYADITFGVSVNYILQTKGRDSVSGQRYVLVMGNPGVVYTVNETQQTLDLYTVMPVNLAMNRVDASVPAYDWTPDQVCTGLPNTPDCISLGHDDTVEGPDGQQYWIQSTYLSRPNAVTIMIVRLNSGKLMGVPEEVGGGLRLTYQLYPGGGIATSGMRHVGCARNAPYCVISTGQSYGGGSQNSSLAQRITGATNADPIQISTNETHPYVAGDVVNIGGVQGNTAANGVWTVQAKINDNAFTINANGTSSGTFVTPTGTAPAVVGRGHTLAPLTYDRDNLLVGITSGYPVFRRMPRTRTVFYQWEDNTNFGYWAMPRAALDHFARYVIWDSNFGEPTQYRVLMGESGLYVPGNIRKASISTGDTQATIAYEYHSSSSCSFEISANANFSPSTAATDSGLFNRTVTFTSLSPSTLYYWRQTNCGQQIRGRLWTSASSAGTSSVVLGRKIRPSLLSGAAKLYVEWGNTVALEKTPFSVSCSTSCSPTVTADKGKLLYFRYTWHNSSDVAVAPRSQMYMQRVK